MPRLTESAFEHEITHIRSSPEQSLSHTHLHSHRDTHTHTLASVYEAQCVLTGPGTALDQPPPPPAISTPAGSIRLGTVLSLDHRKWWSGTTTLWRLTQVCVYVCVRPTTQERLLSVLHFNSSVHAENSHFVHVPLGLTTTKKTGW